MIRVVVSFVLMVLFSNLMASPLDSIGTEKKNGKVYILHKVEPKETLYSLSRKYNVSVDEIKAANVGNTELKVGQTIFIPSKLTSVSSGNIATGSTIKHKVDAKETLYSISRKYDISLEELKKANPGVNELKVGQELTIPVKGKSAVANNSEEKTTNIPDTYVVQPKETYYSISRKFGVSVPDLQKFNPGVKELQVGQEINLKEKAPVNTDATNIEVTVEEQPTRLTVEKKPAQPAKSDASKAYVQVKEPQLSSGPEKNMPTYSNLKKDGYMKINESGIVESYPDNSGFHYALHKTAPIGTIIYLVNEENGQKVYVRVIGKLTDSSPTILMKLSPKAYEKLSQGTSKVKVSATYIP